MKSIRCCSRPLLIHWVAVGLSYGVLWAPGRRHEQSKLWVRTADHWEQQVVTFQLFTLQRLLSAPEFVPDAGSRIGWHLEVVMLQGVFLPSSTSNHCTPSLALISAAALKAIHSPQLSALTYPAHSPLPKPAASQLLTVEAAKIMALLSNDNGSNGMAEKLFLSASRQQYM